MINVLLSCEKRDMKVIQMINKLKELPGDCDVIIEKEDSEMGYDIEVYIPSNKDEVPPVVYLYGLKG